MVEIEKIFALDAIPNAPYAVKAASSEVKNTLASIDSLQVYEDRYGIYAHYKKGSPGRSIVFDSHLDHPGYISVSPYETLAVGSIFNPESITAANKYTPVPVDFFDGGGDLIDRGALTKFQVRNGNYFGILESEEFKNGLPLNIQANLRLPAYQDENIAYMRSADNQAVTALLLQLMAWTHDEQPEADITCIFTKLEEVRQVSATAIAQRNGTRFGNFNSDTLMFVLESDLADEKNEVGIPMKTNYTDGPIIRLGDRELLFKLPGQANLSESLLYSLCEDLAIPFQQGIGVINSDATPYTLFSKTPHIAGIQVPCRYKHNFDPESGFLHEQVRKEDLQRVSQLLQSIVLASGDPIEIHPEAILGNNGIKKYDNDSQLVKQKRKLWNNTRQRAEARLRMGKLTPETPRERLSFYINSLTSRYR